MKRSVIMFILIIILLLGGSSISCSGMDDFPMSKFSDDYKSVVIIADLDTGEIYHANKFAAHYYGYSKEELKNMSLCDLSKGVDCDLREILDVEDEKFRIKQESASGEVLNVEIRAFSYKSNEGELALIRVDDISKEIELERREKTLFRILVGIILTLTLTSILALLNIDKLERYSKEIERYSDLLDSFFRANKNGIFIKDKDFKYIFANEAFADYIDNDLEEILGKTDFDLVDEESAMVYKKDDLKILEVDTVIYNQIRLRGIIQRTTKFPVKLVDGNYGIGAYIEDISEEYKNKEEIKKANLRLDEEREKLELILDTTAEGIYGLDKDGNCTFINNSGLRILGYSKYKNIIGKYMHSLIHHSYENGKTMKAEDCKILNTLVTGVGVKVNDEVLWRADGTSFDAEYIANPQYKNGEIIGVVVTFSDITVRKKSEEEIIYLSYHDSLTGLYNRRFFEVELKRLDVKRNLPLSIVVGDVNGLKLINDVFGHAYGDELIKKAAVGLKGACREDDIVARWGGDEFVILLPNTDEAGADKIIQRIKENISKESVRGIEIALSLGYATKHEETEDAGKIFKSAEANMYEEKTVYYKSADNKIADSILNIIREKSSKVNDHSIRVGDLSAQLGKALGIIGRDLDLLRDAGYYHDIGKVVMQRTFIEMGIDLGKLKTDELKKHPTVGYRILNFSKETKNIGIYVLHHQENWDGTGYPEGLKGEEIPMFSRIIGLADYYIGLVDGIYNGQDFSKEEAIEEIEKESGKRFDPELVKILIKVIE